MDLLMSNFHFGPLTPNRSQVIDFGVRHLCGLLEDKPRVVHLVIFLVELSKINPQRVQLPHRQLGVYSLHCLRVGRYYLK